MKTVRTFSQFAPKPDSALTSITIPSSLHLTRFVQDGPRRRSATPKSPAVKFVLYVADHSPNSTLARTNLATVCQVNLAGRHEVEIVDIFQQPDRALSDAVIMTPMLCKTAPQPVCKIIGTLSDTDAVTATLGLTTVVT